MESLEILQLGQNWDGKMPVSTPNCSGKSGELSVEPF
jgi:hypothetical protein